MTGRIKIIRVKSEVVEGRAKKTEEEFYTCW